MKVKATEIAKALGISKATVSLALNDKGGVSEKTRQSVLECKARLERGEPVGNGTGGWQTGANGQMAGSGAWPAAGGQTAARGMLAGDAGKLENGTILVIKATKGLNIASNAELDLWTDVLWVFEGELRRMGYMTNVIYVNLLTDPVEAILEKCVTEQTRGIVLTATELDRDDLQLFENTELPMVIYDNESLDFRHHSIVADNYRGVETALEHLLGRGYRDIIYLANEKNIYNFRERRRAFCDTMTRRGISADAETRIIPIGTTVNNVYQKASDYLGSHELPEAFIMENYQVSIGMTRALVERGIAVPERLGLIGIDVVPEYMTGNIALTAVRVPHTERAVAAVMMLEKEIQRSSEVKSRILTECRLVEGGSTRGMQTT